MFSEELRLLIDAAFDGRRSIAHRGVITFGAFAADRFRFRRFRSRSCRLIYFFFAGAPSSAFAAVAHLF